jgi:small subunit ribosomal protein S13
MAKEKTEKAEEKARKKTEKTKESAEKEQLPEEKKETSVVRVFSTDIPGSMNVYSGLTRIKGISWAFSSALCNLLGIDKKRKMSSLTNNELEQLQAMIRSPQMPAWLLNRRFDLTTGKPAHLITTDLDIQKEFDIRRLKEIKTYRGWRHALGQPVRGQRTRSHFRTGKAIGVAKGKARELIKAAGKEKGKEKKK